jgi:nucleoside-specific outer membrane channel protein Tsx
VQDDPVDRAALLTEKYDSLLASYAGFTQIVSDPCLDSLTFDVANAQKAFFSQGFANHALSPETPNGMTTTTVTLPFAPTVCVVLWEEYSFSDVDDKTGRYSRTYVEGSGSDLTCTVSFDNGVNFNPVANGAVFNIPALEQGVDFSIGFTNTGSSRVYLGSWSVIF